MLSVVVTGQKEGQRRMLREKARYLAERPGRAERDDLTPKLKKNIGEKARLRNEREAPGSIRINYVI